jgi:hypothetical protein
MFAAAHRVISLRLEFGRYRGMADIAGPVVDSLLLRMTLAVL